MTVAAMTVAAMTVAAMTVAAMTVAGEGKGAVRPALSPAGPFTLRGCFSSGNAAFTLAEISPPEAADAGAGCPSW